MAILNKRDALAWVAEATRTEEQLSRACVAQGLAHTGTRAELVARLQTSLNVIPNDVDPSRIDPAALPALPVAPAQPAPQQNPPVRQPQGSLPWWAWLLIALGILTALAGTAFAGSRVWGQTQTVEKIVQQTVIVQQTKVVEATQPPTTAAPTPVPPTPTFTNTPPATATPLPTEAPTRDPLVVALITQVAELKNMLPMLMATPAASGTPIVTGTPGIVASADVYSYIPGGPGYAWSDGVEAIDTDGWTRIRRAANGQYLAWTFFTRIRCDRPLTDQLQWDSATKLNVFGPVKCRIELRRDLESKISPDQYTVANAKNSPLGLGWYVTGVGTLTVKDNAPVNLTGPGVKQLGFPKEWTGTWIFNLEVPVNGLIVINQGEKLTSTDNWPLPK